MLVNGSGRNHKVDAEECAQTGEHTSVAGPSRVAWMVLKKDTETALVAGLGPRGRLGHTGRIVSSTAHVGHLGFPANHGVGGDREMSM